jgi:hypothetical protein
MQTIQHDKDPHHQLRALYRSLLDHEDRYHEFKQLLMLYPSDVGALEASPEAEALREQLNHRIREWVGGPFEGLSAMQMLLWRGILVEERFNVALAPWKESNMY